MKDLGNKFQFLVTLSLFFPVIISSTVDAALANKAIIGWGVTVSYLILIYLYLDSAKRIISNKILKYINLSFDINIFLFIPFILGVVLQHKFPIIAGVIFAVGFFGIAFFPVLIFLVLFVFLCIKIYKKLFSKI